MKRIIAVLTVLAVTAAVLAIPALARTRSVSVRDNLFSPRSLTIKRNDIVRFVWRGRNPHNITTRSRPRGGTRVTASARRTGTYRKRFTRRGTYRLLCTIHAPDMRMTVRVR
jgi:plastocyanin